jgi:DNA polymerase (family X)
VAVKRKEVVATLERIAQLLELKGESPFRARAYQTAARAVKGLEQELDELVRTGALSGVPGIGKGTAALVEELLRTGRSSLHESLRDELGAGVVELLEIPGLGPKKVRQIHDELGIGSVGELEYACHENRLTALPGFGAKSQDKVLAAIAFYKKNREWSLYSDAIDVAERGLAAVRALAGVEHAEITGALRRRCEVVRSVELLAATADASVLERFAAGRDVLELLELGPDRTRVRLRSGGECTLRLCRAEDLGAVLAYETGSPEHNEQLAALARERSLDYGEAGLRQGGVAQRCADEAELYARLGLPFIEPPLREGLGEVAAAQAGRLPHLVQREDIRGVLHNHTTWSDGAASLEAMVRQAERRGFEYILVSDHSKSASYAGGLSEQRVREQAEEIDRVQEQFPGIRILKGIEVDILPDGSLDYADEVLAGFDLVIASVHSSFHLGREEMTRRIVRALESPHVDVLGHPTGRLLLARKPYEMDLDAVLATAARTGAAIEINASPQRLDLDWRLLREASAQGVRFCIDPDAHHIDGIDFVRFGVGIAQKGWVEPESVWNTRGVDELLEGLARRG